MARMSRKELRQDEVAEAAVEAKDWLEENLGLVMRWAAGVAVIGAVGLGIWFWMQSQATKARAAFSAAHADFLTADETGFTDFDAMSAALDGFEKLAAKGGKTADSAKYYQAVTLNKMGRTEEALPLLEELAGAGTATLRASSQTLLANLYVEAGRVDDAIALMATAAEAGDGLPIDQALMHQARLLEGEGREAEAKALWQRLQDEFENTPGANEAARKLAS